MGWSTRLGLQSELITLEAESVNYYKQPSLADGS